MEANNAAVPCTDIIFTLPRGYDSSGNELRIGEILLSYVFFYIRNQANGLVLGSFLF